MIIAGIGARKTPTNVLRLMTKVGEWAAREGHTVRSGHAPGADYAFECGAKDNTVIYLPWYGFNSCMPKMTKQVVVYEEIENSTRARAMASVTKFHPASRNLKQSVKILMARNYFQVFGHGILEQQVRFVFCWTPGGRGGGGTGQAIRIAKHHGIKVFDMGNPQVYQAILKRMEDK